MENEIWRDVPNYEGLYQVSDQGNFKSMDRVVKRGNHKMLVKSQVIKPQMHSTGYYFVMPCKLGKKKTIKIHQLVAMAFLGHVRNGYKSVIDHIDGNQLNNAVSNLQILTHRKNISKGKVGGTSKYTGVCWDKWCSKWKSTIQLNGANKHLGVFTDELDASKAYQTALANHLKQTT